MGYVMIHNSTIRPAESLAKRLRYLGWHDVIIPAAKMNLGHGTKTVRHIVDVYAANANKYERLGDWAERIGWESFFKMTGLEFTHHLIDDFREAAYYTWRQSTQFKF